MTGRHLSADLWTVCEGTLLEACFCPQYSELAAKVLEHGSGTIRQYGRLSVAGDHATIVQDSTPLPPERISCIDLFGGGGRRRRQRGRRDGNRQIDLARRSSRRISTGTRATFPLL